MASLLDDIIRFTMKGSNYFKKPRLDTSRLKDPALYSGFSMNKHRTAPFNYNVEGDLLGNLIKPKTVSPSDLQGKTMYFAAGDRTSNDRLIKKVNDSLLENPVRTYGGPEYMDQIKRGSWASEPTAMRSKANAFKEAAARGEDVILSYMPMGERSGDFSKHMAEVYGEMLKSSPVGSNSFPLIDEAIANKFPKIKDIPSFKNKTKFAEWLSNQKGGRRAAFIKFFDSSLMQDLGLPDVGAARFAITNPDLVNSKALSVGYRMSQPDLLSGIIKSSDHPSYGAFVPKREGTGSMTFENELPFIIGARDTALPKIAAGKMDALPKDIKSYMGNPRLNQNIDQQFVDEASTYFDKLKNEGADRAEAYTFDLLESYLRGLQ